MNGTHIQVSLLWCVLMLVYFSVDMLRIFSLDARQGSYTTQFRQPIRLGISMLMGIPILMLVLLWMLPQPVGRWTTIVMAGFGLLCNAMGLPTDFCPYDRVLISIGLILNIVTVWLTWSLATT